MSYNSITKIENLHSLDKLEELDLSNNSIDRLTPEDGIPDSIVSLNMSNNELYMLKDLTYLSDHLNLSDVKFSGNKISYLSQY